MGGDREGSGAQGPQGTAEIPALHPIHPAVSSPNYIKTTLSHLVFLLLEINRFKAFPLELCFTRVDN